MIYNIICLLILDVAFSVTYQGYYDPAPSFSISYLRSVHPKECPCQVSVNCDDLPDCHVLERAIENTRNKKYCEHDHGYLNGVGNCPGNYDVFIKETQSSRTIWNPNPFTIGPEGFGCNKHIAGTTNGISRPRNSYLKDDEMLWSFYAQENTEMTIDMCHSQYDSKITVYSSDPHLNFGARVKNMVLQVYEDDDHLNCEDRNRWSPHVTFHVEKDYEYFIKIGGYNGEKGHFRMNITCENSITRINQAVHKYSNAIANIEHEERKLPEGTTLFDDAINAQRRQKSQEHWREVVKDHFWVEYYEHKGDQIGKYAAIANLAKAMKDAILADPNLESMQDGDAFQSASEILDVAPAVFGTAQWGNALSAAAANPASAWGGAPAGARIITALRAIDPNLRVDKPTEEIENRVFNHIGGGATTGAAIGCFIGAFGGPPGAVLGAAFGGMGGSVIGLVLEAIEPK